MWLPDTAISFVVRICLNESNAIFTPKDHILVHVGLHNV